MEPHYKDFENQALWLEDDRDVKSVKSLRTRQTFRDVPRIPAHSLKNKTVSETSRPDSSESEEKSPKRSLPVRRPSGSHNLRTHTLADQRMESTTNPFASNLRSNCSAGPLAPPKPLSPRPKIKLLGSESSDETIISDKHRSDKPTGVVVEDFDKFYTPQNQHFYENSPYEGLKSTRYGIRVVRVFPRKSVWEHFRANPCWDRSLASDINDHLQILACQIENTSLPSVDGQYTTLSYSAGDLNDTKVMLVNGIPFNAFANLEHAIECLLKHQSHAQQERLKLWIDQICINQSDKEELGHQVQLMRDIYRRSERTFVCLSTPKNGDGLSWIPRVPNYCAHLGTSDGDTPGVVVLKNLLLDFLVGKGRGGELRPQKCQVSETMHGLDEEIVTQDLFPEVSAMTTSRTHSPRIDIRRVQTVHGQAQAMTPITMRLSQGSIQSSLNRVQGLEEVSMKRGLPTPELFQSSLLEFMRNKWWRRSWVYQEFISSKTVHFLSDTECISWPELAPFVDFVCNDLDAFIESVRVYFDSMITVEMEAEEKRRLDRMQAKKSDEERRKREEQERQRQEEEEKRTKAEARRRKELEEKRRRDNEQKRRMRRIEAKAIAEREAERNFIQEMEDYRNKLANFEIETHHQWEKARQRQTQARMEYETRQKFDVQEELKELWSQRAALKLHSVDERLQLRRKEKILNNFLEELQKPIEDQIEFAREFKFKRENLNNKVLKSDKRCGGRRLTKTRIEELLNLDQVPKSPESFEPEGLTRPSTPIKRICVEFGAMGGAQQFRIDPTTHLVSPISQPTDAISPLRLPRSSKPPGLYASQSTSRFPYLTEDEDLSLEEDLFPARHEKADSPTGNAESTNLRRISLEHLGFNEVQRRDNIISLQNKFRLIDRSAIASMARGKQTFRRSSDLKSLLQHSRNCEASDLRDRVYAFLGLAHQGYEIIPDYRANNDIRQVLVQAAKGILRFDKSLDILQHVYRGRDHIGFKLPTWVPDWTSQETSLGLDQFTFNDSVQSIPFNAANGLPAKVEFSSGSGDDFHEDLKVRGILFDLIEEEDCQESPALEQISTFVTTKGDPVVGPKAARHGDEIWVLYGSARPAVLRRNGERVYGYLGDALVYDKATGELSDVMFGRLVKKMRGGELDASRERDVWLM